MTAIAATFRTGFPALLAPSMNMSSTTVTSFRTSMRHLQFYSALVIERVHHVPFQDNDGVSDDPCRFQSCRLPLAVPDSGRDRLRGQTTPVNGHQLVRYIGERV